MRSQDTTATAFRLIGTFSLTLIALLVVAAPALAAPSATTEPVGTLHHTSVILHGHLDPTGDPGITECHFDWGVDTTYSGGTVPCDQGNSFSAPADVSAALGFLTDGFTYHFRLTVTTTSSGVLHGADQSFVTPGFSVVHDELGAFGPDGTAGSFFDSPQFDAIALNPTQRELFAFNPLPGSVSGANGEIYGFDISNPLSLSAVPGFNPLSTEPTGGADVDVAVDATAGPSAGNVFYKIGSVNEVQQLTVSASAGTFRLCFEGACTEDLPFDVPLSGFPGETYLFKAFKELATIGGAGGYLPLSGGPGNASGSNPYVLPFSASLAERNVPQFTCDGSNLSGGSGCSVTTTTEGHDSQVLGVDSTGNPLGGNFPLEPADGSSLRRIAVDTAGHIWIANSRTGQATEYSATGTFLGSVDTSAQITIFKGGSANPEGVISLAFDAENNLYASGGESITGPGERLSDGTWRYTASSGYTEATKVAPFSGPFAIDESNGHYFVGPEEYDPAGNLLGTLPLGYRVQVDPANHYLYTTTSSFVNGVPQGQVHVFGPAIPVELATVTPEPATNLLGTSATLNAKVDPEGNQVTGCRFEWIDDATYQADIASEGVGHGFSHAQDAPCAQDPGAGSGDVDVSSGLSGLEAGTGYHFRIVAENANGPATGPGQALTTLGPQVSSPKASLVDDSSATLSGQVNPAGKDTAYHFEYGTQGPCDSNPCTSVPASGAPAGAGSTPVPVSQPLSGLAPVTTYHFRLVATNADATSHTHDATFTTYGARQKFDPCANDALRSGPGAALPDCRAYEQASPVDKNGTDIKGGHDVVQASLAGDAITFISRFGLPGAIGAQRFPSYLARRSPQGWSTQGLNPPAAMGDRVTLQGNTPDLLQTFTGVADFAAPQGKGPAFVMRDSATGKYTFVHSYTDITGAGTANAASLLAGSSSDGSKVYFENPQIKLANKAIAGKHNLYLWNRDTEKVSLAGVLPNGSTPPGGSFAGPYNWWYGNDVTSNQLEDGGIAKFYFTESQNAISDAGDKAFFTAGGTGQLYLRRDAAGKNPSTVQVSASKASPPDPNGARRATFMAATPSGSKAFFASCEKLTDDSTAHSSAAGICTTKSQGQDLYAYDTATGGLSDLTVDSNPADVCPGTAIPCGAQVQGVVGISASGDYVYFVANGDLDGAGPAALGDCRRDNFNLGRVGECNLYLWHAGTTSFIAKLDALFDDENWEPARVVTGNEPTGRVSANGQAVLFQARHQLGASQGTDQLYLYRAGDAAPRCVSCNPTGGAPAGASLTSIESGSPGVNTNVPAPTRNLSADGNRVFFESSGKLAAADVNGDAGCAAVGSAAVTSCQDVYEWEAPGTGSCSLAAPAYSAQNGGCLYLLSSGTSPSPSYFGDASASGDDVFIFTRDSLVPQDTDELMDVYDARVGGGLPAQHAVPPPPCDVNAGACEGAASARGEQPGAGSAAFQGPPNPKPQATRCPKGRREVRRHGKVRCLKPHPRKHKRNAGRNRGTSR